MPEPVCLTARVTEEQLRALEAVARARGWSREEAVRRAIAAGLALLEAQGPDGGAGSGGGNLLTRWADARAANAALQYRYYEALESARVADLHLAALRAENEHLRLLVERLRSSGAGGGR